MDNDIIEEISQRLAGMFTDPILIGGIASIKAGYTTEATNDVDAIIVISDRQVVAQVLRDYSERPMSGGVKGRGTFEGIHVDVYFPYQSKLGDAARLDVATIAEYRGQRHGNWTLLTAPAQFVTKVAALLDRAAKSKGERDAQVLLTMIDSGVDGAESRRVFLRCAEAAGAAGLWSQARDELVDRAPGRREQQIRAFFGA
ncbi:hypothetical protein [Mycolicibacterium sp.]|uniref:hypothetical protein n=1 Tax=Mycolicibacterium sp. TaxID=2320850 RepID=UPI003560CF1A